MQRGRLAAAAPKAVPAAPPGRRVLRDAVERAFCGYACCVRRQVDAAGVVGCTATFAEHLMPERLPFVENAALLQERLPCPPCLGNDGLCCKDAAERAGPAFELAKLRQVLDVRRIEGEFQACAAHAPGEGSACVRAAAACARQHLESYARHAAGGAPLPPDLPADAVVACHREAVRECGFHGDSAAPCSLRCVLGTNPADAAEAARRLREAGPLPPGCTASRLMRRGFG